jgi:RNA polymerase sigma factor (sigma-70 family)
MKRINKVLEHLRNTLPSPELGDRTDAQLLDDFVSRSHGAALEALARRHGPMVWGVCRRILRDHHDTEDAFQATFLVLVRKAAVVVPREQVGNWLYGVARQTALKARATTARRRCRERQVTHMPEPAFEQELWDDLRPVLDQELSRLPNCYQAAIVLCDLEGKTRREAARQLDCPEGTLAARLARGRVLLARRLARQGLAISGGALAALLSREATCAEAPSANIIRAVADFAAGQSPAAGVVSAEAITLAQGVLKSMLLSKIKFITVALLLIAILGAGALGHYRQTPAAAQAEPARHVAKKGNVQPAAAQAKDAIKKEKQRLEGLWEDCEEEGNTYLFQGNIIEHRSTKDGKTRRWAYRLDPSQSPPSIDIFSHTHNGPGGTGRGIYELDGDDLTIAYAEPRAARATKFERGGGLSLLVLKRVKAAAPAPGRKEAKDGPITVHGILDVVDADHGTVSVKSVCGNTVASALTLKVVAASIANMKPDVSVAAMLALARTRSRLVEVPVRRDAALTSAGKTVKLAALRAGVVVAVDLAPDRAEGLVITGIRAEPAAKGRGGK